MMACGWRRRFRCIGFDFFLTGPYNSFSIDDRVDVQTAVLLVVVGAAVTEIALWGLRQQARASQEQGYLDGVVGTAATVAAGRVPTDSLIDGVTVSCVASSAPGALRWHVP